MQKIGLFYGSKRGNTQDAATRIKEAFDAIEQDLVTVVNIKKVEDPSIFAKYDVLILGSSTWEKGQLQAHWKRFLPTLETLDLTGKKVAVFGLGDQSEFCTTFQGGMGILARKVRERGGELVGFWPNEGYTFVESPALEEGQFPGLALDYMNQGELTKERIETWVQQLQGELSL
jgi:flavodoxin I